jgi:hypothetical protein
VVGPHLPTLAEVALALVIVCIYRIDHRHWLFLQRGVLAPLKTHAVTAQVSRRVGGWPSLQCQPPSALWHWAVFVVRVAVAARRVSAIPNHIFIVGARAVRFLGPPVRINSIASRLGLGGGLVLPGCLAFLPFSTPPLLGLAPGVAGWPGSPTVLRDTRDYNPRSMFTKCKVASWRPTCLPQLTATICLCTQRPEMAADIATCATPCSGL